MVTHSNSQRKSLKLEVTNSKGKCYKLLFKVKKVIEEDIHVCHIQIATGMTNFSSSGKCCGLSDRPGL